jgi:manganese-dependent inorganic pyrophosphatase
MKRRIAALLMMLAMTGSCGPAGAETALLADLLRSVDYGDGVTYVIGHKSPDADTIGSAIAYAWLLQQLGINARPAAAAEVNRETRYALELFGMAQPEILTDAAGKQFILVDHSEYSQALDGMKDARVVGIVDHHGIGDVRNTQRIPVLSLPAGAAASIVYRMYLDCGVEIPRDMARVLLMAVLSDTKGMNSNVTQLDREAVDALRVIAEISDIGALYAGMKAAKASFEGMTVSEIFHSDYKEYTAGAVTFGVSSVYTEAEESLAELAEKIEAEFPSLYAQDGQDLLFCLISTDETSWMIWYGEGAEQAVRESFPEYDGSGRMIFVPKASRKENIVPPLTAALENWER